MWKEAVWLAKKEYQYQWLAFFGTFIASLVLGGIVGLMLTGPSGDGFAEFSVYLHRFILDLFFIGIAPSLATFFMAKPYLSFQNARQNPYGKRMAVLRSLPVPASVLSLSRILLMLSTLVIMSLAFYGMMGTVLYGYMGTLFDTLTFGGYVVFGFFWFGFAMAVGGMNPYIEYGMKGTMLHVLPYLYMALFAVVEVILLMNRVGIVEKSFELIKWAGWPAAVISLILGALCCFGWNKLLKNRLENRDYL
ncbi:hypothetical protein [Bacillus tuaregi]|uniref:hypothetical protein n=1 Tax=Bacillus tuaregi TaxID=1816695 RepID=UPI0008F8E810|nr:hypothetical protein [Bacillus tuaregi]